MSPIVFDERAVENWAHFSGDRNPIHFDVEIARRAGLGGATVHGMLTLLPLKQAFSDSLAESDGDDWWRWSALLKRPLPINSACQVRSPAPTLALRRKMQLTGTVAETRYVTATACHHAKEEVSPSLAIHALSRGELLEKRAAFLRSFPDIRHPWIFLDCLLFSRFLALHFGDFMLSIGGDGLVAASRRGEGLLMQVGHQVVAPSSVFRGEQTMLDAEFRYGMRVVCTSTVGDAHLAVLQLFLLQDEKLALLTEISVMSQMGLGARLNVRSI